jgi:hypothetical protein
MDYFKYIAEREAEHQSFLNQAKAKLEDHKRWLELFRGAVAYRRMMHEIYESIEVKHYEWNGKKMVRASGKGEKT